MLVVLNDEKTYSNMEGTILVLCNQEQVDAADASGDPLDAHKAGAIAIDLAGLIRVAVKMGALAPYENPPQGWADVVPEE
jgi:hypothetical protein